MSDRKYTWNGKTFPISRPDLSDVMVAGHVRMLMREQLNHEFVCTMARDRIMCLTAEKDALTARVKELEGECERLNEIINSPENDDFVRGVSIEAEHQIQRWGDDHDKEKNGWDWFWTIGYLSQKAAASFEAGEFEKTQHHCITTAALMKNFHSRVSAALKGDAS